MVLRKQRNLVPTSQDVEVLKAISKELGPLLEFTESLSGAQLVTGSYLKPVLSLFKTNVQPLNSDGVDLSK